MKTRAGPSEPPHDKTNNMAVRPAKTQISLGICPVWSESSLCAQWEAKDPSFLHADSEDSDQTGRMPNLIWVFAGHSTTLLVLSWGGSSQDWILIDRALHAGQLTNKFSRSSLQIPILTFSHICGKSMNVSCCKAFPLSKSITITKIFESIKHTLTSFSCNFCVAHSSSCSNKAMKSCVCFPQRQGYFWPKIIMS